jgi:hypothetical protein
MLRAHIIYFYEIFMFWVLSMKRVLEHHDSSINMLYREFYVYQRLANINGKLNPNQPEVFLDESYCHVDHFTGRIWVRPRGVINESGRKPMLVIFAGFIVFKKSRGRRAKIIQKSVNI